MASHPRIRNIAVAMVLAVVFYVGTLLAPQFVSPEKTQFQVMLDWVSLPMLGFGVYLFGILVSDTLGAFWGGDRARGAIALYGLFLLVVSSDMLRTYGIATRNFEAFAWLEHTYLYSAGVYLAFIGLWFLSHASRAPAVEARPNRWGQLVAGIVIGAIIASSKMIEPAIAMMGKLLASMFTRL